MCVGDWMEKKDDLRRSRIYIYLIAIIGIVLDQITKFVVRSQFNLTSCAHCLSEMVSEGGKIGIFRVVPNRGIEIIPNFFYIINVKNTGGAWGLFSNNVTFLAIISAFVGIMVYFFIKKEEELKKMAITYYGLLLSGIIGNLIDRVFNGYVTDFLNFYILGYDYPVFNIADILIVLGIVLMVIDVVRSELNARHMRKGKYTN